MDEDDPLLTHGSVQHALTPLESGPDNDPPKIHGAEVSTRIAQPSRDDAEEWDEDAQMKDLVTSNSSFQDHGVNQRDRSAPFFESRVLQQRVSEVGESSRICNPAGESSEARSVKRREFDRSPEHTPGGDDAWTAHGPYEPQHSASDGEDDMQRGTREAVEHMRSTEDAAGEILDDSTPSCVEGRGADQFSSSVEANGSLQNRASLFPGVSGNADSASSGRRLEPRSSAEALTFNRTHVNLQREETSGLERSRNVREQESSVECADTDRSGVQRYEPPFTDHGSSGPEENSTLWAYRPPSFFPGPYSFLPGSNRVANDVLPRSTNPPKPSTAPGPPLSATRTSSAVPPATIQTRGNQNIATQTLATRRRKHDEMEDPEVHIRSSRERTLALLERWESMKEELDSIENFRDDLEQDRIYVKGTVNIRTLSGQEHPTIERSWSWSRTEKDRFDTQLRPLLREGFRLQVITSKEHSPARQYRAISHLEYWDAHFTDRRLNWLAVISPEVTHRRGPEKIRRV